MEVGEWVQVSLGIFFSFGKSCKNCPRSVLILWSSIPCVVVNYCDLSVLSTSVMSFQKEKFGWWWVGWVSSIQFYFWFFKLCKAPLPCERGSICSSGRRGTPSGRAQGSLAATQTTCPGTEPSSSGRGCWHWGGVCEGATSWRRLNACSTGPTSERMRTTAMCRQSWSAASHWRNKNKTFIWPKWLTRKPPT